jgi:hypothetical protein
MLLPPSKQLRWIKTMTPGNGTYALRSGVTLSHDGRLDLGRPLPPAPGSGEHLVPLDDLSGRIISCHHHTTNAKSRIKARKLDGSYPVRKVGPKQRLRIILSDGSSIRLDNVPATDPAGYAGLADKVDFHTWTLLKGAAVSTLLGVGANLSFSGESDLVQAIRQSTQQNVSRAGDQLTSRNLQIQPTITIRPGTPVRLVVHRDLILAPRKQ